MWPKPNSRLLPTPQPNLLNPELSRLLQSIPGVGPKVATLLIAELSDITRFKDAKAVVAYTGLDPKVKQSGKLLKRNTKLTKRGSPIYAGHCTWQLRQPSVLIQS